MGQSREGARGWVHACDVERLYNVDHAVEVHSATARGVRELKLLIRGHEQAIFCSGCKSEPQRGFRRGHINLAPDALEALHKRHSFNILVIDSRQYHARLDVGREHAHRVDGRNEYTTSVAPLLQLQAQDFHHPCALQFVLAPVTVWQPSDHWLEIHRPSQVHPLYRCFDA